MLLRVGGKRGCCDAVGFAWVASVLCLWFLTVRFAGRLTSAIVEAEVLKTAISAGDGLAPGKDTF